MADDFELTIDELRTVARFVAACAIEVLPVFETAHPDDPRPRAAIDAAQAFVNGATRSNVLRSTAVDAHCAAREATTESARLAAQAAGDAAAAAYLHPIASAHQVGHILRAAANAACIAELGSSDDPDAARRSLDRARQRAHSLVIDVLRRYPSPSGRGGRPAQLMAELDALLRRR